MERMNDIIGLSLEEYARIERMVMDNFEEGTTYKESLTRVLRILFGKPMTLEQKKIFTAAFVFGVMHSRNEFNNRARDIVGNLASKLPRRD